MNKVYLKDNEGSTMVIGESSINGEVVHHYPQFKAIGKVLQEIPNDTQRKDDVWLFTYPKSGSHWTYEILGILLSGNLQPLKMFKLATMLELLPDYSRIRDYPSPRLVDTHVQMKYLPKSVLETGKIVCVIRNPKSVAVSFYLQYCKLKENDYSGTFAGFLPMYMNGIDNLFGSWFDYNLDLWDKLSGKRNVLFVFYEDLIQDPVENIKKMSDFLGVGRDLEFCKEVAKLTSFEKMNSFVGKDEGMIKHVSTLWKDGGNHFFRKGIIDDWKNHFSKAQNEEFDKFFESKMKSYPNLRSKIRFE